MSFSQKNSFISLCSQLISLKKTALRKILAFYDGSNSFFYFPVEISVSFAQIKSTESYTYANDMVISRKTAFFFLFSRFSFYIIKRKYLLIARNFTNLIIFKSRKQTKKKFTVKRANPALRP